MTSFQPADPLEAAIHAGRLPAVLDALRALTPAQRSERRAALLRIAKLLDEANWARGDAAENGWGAKPTREQVQAYAAAMLVCGTAKDAAQLWIGDELLVECCREFQPRALEGLVDALLERSPQCIRAVQALVAAGLAPRPESQAYVLGLIALPQVLRDADRLKASLAADPGLAPALLRVFGVEGTAEFSLASSDKYNHVQGLAWGQILLGLVDAGVTTRAALLDRTLAALENDWPQYRSGWFSRFHAELAPDAAALRPHLSRYLALCHSRVAPTVGLALDALAALDADRPLDGAALLEALRSVLASAVKAQVEAALKLVDRVVERAPALRASAAPLVAVALVHESAPLQKAILRRLGAWGVDDAVRALLRSLASGVAAVNRPTLLQLAGEAEVPRGADRDAAPPPATMSARIDPLDAARSLAPIGTVGELVECIAHVFENDTDVDAFERVIAALVARSPLADDVRRALAPVLKRAAKVRKPIARELARLLVFVADGRRVDTEPSVDAGGNASPMQAVLIRRVDALMALAMHGAGLEPLSAPTHRRGFIAPARFVERVAAHQAKGLHSTLGEQVLGLLRLAPSADAGVKARARQLADEPFTRALRYALGDELEPGAQHELFAAAARIRHPGQDDAALASRQGDLGPDAALAARYDWRVHSWESQGQDRTYHFHDMLVETAAVPADVPPERLAVLRHPPPGDETRAHFRWWSFCGVDEGSVCYGATLLPSCPDAFFAEGARAIGNNLDWWEAQWHNAAYLRLLLDPSCAMSPMATLLLALGLAGKEPGQTAIAVDALVQSALDGRLDVALLGDTLRRLLATPLPKATRLRNSLLAATRADTALRRPVFELLGIAVTAAPDAPPRDLAALLELLLELKLALGVPLTAVTREALGRMGLTGRAKGLHKDLLG